MVVEEILNFYSNLCIIFVITKGSKGMPQQAAKQPSCSIFYR